MSFLCALGIEPRALHRLGKRSASGATPPALCTFSTTYFKGLAFFFQKKEEYCIVSDYFVPDCNILTYFLK
jgi:hypothetical protein